MEEKRLDAQRDMYKFMQKMMTINTNNNNNQEQEQRKELFPEELTTGTTGQTSAITTSSIVTASSSIPSAKRSSSQLPNSNEETEMKDNETVTEVQNEEDALSIKRNKTLIGEEDTENDNIIYDDNDMTIENVQQDNPINTNETI
jgi:hypothetical protein